MKKIFAISFLFLFIASSAIGGEHTIFTGQYNQYNTFLKKLVPKDYKISYEDKENVFYLYMEEFVQDAWIALGTKEMIQLRGTIEKYFEWEKTAIDNKVTLDKEFPDARIKTKVIWTSGSNAYTSNPSGLTLVFSFFSQNTQRHQFTVESTEARSVHNSYITYKMETMYFDKLQINELYKAISEENLQKQIKAVEEQKKKEDMFK